MKKAARWQTAEETRLTAKSRAVVLAHTAALEAVPHKLNFVAFNSTKNFNVTTSSLQTSDGETVRA